MRFERSGGSVRGIAKRKSTKPAMSGMRNAGRRERQVPRSLDVQSMTRRSEPPTTTATGSFKAKVLSYDPRRGTAVFVTKNGRRIRASWEVLRHVPVLLRGMEVQVVVGEDGQAEKITTALDRWTK